MLSSRSLTSFVLAGLVGTLPLLAGGCDRQASPPAQQGAETDVPDQPADPSQAGGLDRSHKGAAIPAITVEDKAGHSLDLASLKGQPFVMNLWATWCAPCIAELPTLDALDKAGTVRVVAVSQDMAESQNKVAGFLRSHAAPTLAPWYDPNTDLSFQYGGNLPITVLFDSQGKEVWRWTGGNEWNSAEAAKLIAEAH